MFCSSGKWLLFVKIKCISLFTTQKIDKRIFLKINIDKKEMRKKEISKKEVFTNLEIWSSLRKSLKCGITSFSSEQSLHNTNIYLIINRILRFTAHTALAFCSNKVRALKEGDICIRKGKQAPPHFSPYQNMLFQIFSLNLKVNLKNNVLSWSVIF